MNTNGTDSGDGNWLRDADTIYAESFRIIAQEADFSHLPPDTHHIAARIIHACGLPELAAHLRIGSGLQKAVENAILQGCQIITDTEMTRAGIMRRLLPPGVQVHCLLRQPQTRQLAGKCNTTLTAAAVDRWDFQPQRAICVIGNAPTALFRLMERITAGELMPAAVLAFPVGFVGAAESKEIFLQQYMQEGVKGATLLGRAGGAGMAAAALNAMLLAMQQGGSASQ